MELWVLCSLNVLKNWMVLSTSLDIFNQTQSPVYKLAVNFSENLGYVETVPFYLLQLCISLGWKRWDPVRFQYKNHLIRVRQLKQLEMSPIFVAKHTAGCYPEVLPKISHGLMLTSVETQSWTASHWLGSLLLCNSITIHSTSWNEKSGHEHLLWTWNDMFCRNVIVVHCLWHVQMWKYELFAEMSNANTCIEATGLKNQSLLSLTLFS